MDRTNVNVRFEPIAFRHLAPPAGFIDADPHAWACWYYYILARKRYEEMCDNIVYEGELDLTGDFLGLFKGVAKLYGVAPEGMAKCWQMVDMQCYLQNLPLLPDEEKYRFNRVIIVS